MAAFGDRSSLAVLLEKVEARSAKRKAEEQAQKASKLSDIIIDSLPGIFFMHDRQTNTLMRWNKRVQDVTGFTETEISGKNFIEFIAPKYQVSIRADVKDMPGIWILAFFRSGFGR